MPLLVLTADRPPELRDCASGQTIDQQHLFGRYVRAYTDLALPEATVGQLRYLRQRLVYAWQQCQIPVAGPVHLNCPFRDPLAPVPTAAAKGLAAELDEPIFQHLRSCPPQLSSRPAGTVGLPLSLGRTDRGLIIAGPVHPPNPAAYCDAIATLATTLGWPVLADGLSPLRNHSPQTDYRVTTYDVLLRHRHHAERLSPEQVIQVGALPTSKVLRQWLANVDPQRWVLDSDGRNKDPLHGRVIPLPVSLAEVGASLSADQATLSAYAKDWLAREAIARQRLGAQLATIPTLFEGKLSWLLPQLLPPDMPLMIANSMPVRDVEWFWPVSDRGIRPYFSRGANGIDGTLSTAMGIAQAQGRAVLVTGDLALLHDSNGLLNASQLAGQLTILLVNNHGGGIFETLPIAQFDPPFEAFFATPQAVDFGHLATAHGVTYCQVESWSNLTEVLSVWPACGVRLIEMRCDRKADALMRQQLLQAIGDFTV